MYRGAGLLGVAAVLACLAAVTACTPDPEKPTLEAAVQQLVRDGDELLASYELKQVGEAKVTERAEKDQTGSCVPGEVQRFFRAEGDIVGRHAAFNAAGLIQNRLALMGYDEFVDDLDLRDQNLAVAVARDPATDVTYVVTVQLAQKPNIRIVGKTACYESSG
ncbi:hypothetical protein OUY22_13910 [Nonomuraea sp. MCN248]|uniref:Lipoprotein n=1 Tax=Nonomuraea corallina TaxID=2989783 RepID=A0ABT4SC07_9ACTN|nr:hypothetical protein [Nonomuraea corallina]MDA0634515.1 hypothetical protein [Nonomuraea corallina]